MLYWIKKYLLVAIVIMVIAFFLQGYSIKANQLEPKERKLIEELDKIINKTVDHYYSYHAKRSDAKAWERFLKIEEEGKKLGLKVYSSSEAWERFRKIVKKGEKLDLTIYSSSENAEKVIKLALAVDSTLITDYPKTTWGRGRHIRLESLICGYETQKRWAIWCLGQLGYYSEAIAILIKSFATAPVILEGNVNVSEIVPYKLKEYIMDTITTHGQDALPQLIAKIDKEGPGRPWIKATIMKIGDANGIDLLVDELIQDLGDTEQYDLEETAIALSKASPFVVPKLIDAIHKSQGEYPLWHYASEALSRIENPKAIGELEKAFVSEDAWIRENIVKSLGNMAGDGSANSIACQALQDDNSRVRYYAAESLGLINYFGQTHGMKKMWLWIKNFFVTTREVKALIKAVQDSDNDVCYRAVWSLGEIGNSKAIPVLLMAITNKDPYLREEAAIAMGKIKHSKALPLLKESTRDDNLLVREASIWAIGQIDTTLADDLRKQDAETDTVISRDILVPGKNLKAYWRYYHDMGWGTEHWQIPFVGETTGRFWTERLRWASVTIEFRDPDHDRHYGWQGDDEFHLSDYTMVARIRGDGGEKIWLTFIDSWDYVATWRGLVKLPPLPEGRAETIKIDFAKLAGRFNPNHLYQIVFNFGGMAWDMPLNPNGAAITIEDVKFIPNLMFK